LAVCLPYQVEDLHPGRPPLRSSTDLSRRTECPCKILTAAYLITAFLFRFWNARKNLTFAEIQFDEWSKRLHNHISSSEIKLIKRKMTLNPTAHFESVSAVVGGLHLLLAFGITQFKVFL
jgi:hypothetical protein